MVIAVNQRNPDKRRGQSSLDALVCYPGIEHSFAIFAFILGLFNPLNQVWLFGFSLSFHIGVLAQQNAYVNLLYSRCDICS
jgi:hypothetical protein